MRTEVFLTRTGAYLPFAPVSNDEIEGVLGCVGGKPCEVISACTPPTF